MGYYSSGHIVKSEVDLEQLRNFPDCIVIRAYEVEGHEFTLIDTDFRNRKIWRPEFPANQEPLNALFKSLEKAGVSICFNHQLVLTNMLMSRYFESEVLSYESNDDLLDLVIVSENGTPRKIRFRAEDIEVLYEGDGFQITPFLNELDDPPYVDIGAFDSKQFDIRPREDYVPVDLHHVALEEVSQFVNVEKPILGLGGTDPEETREIFSLNVGESARADSPSPRKPSRRFLDTSFWAGLPLVSLSIALLIGSSGSEILSWGPMYVAFLIGIGFCLLYFIAIYKYGRRCGANAILWTTVAIVLFPGGTIASYIASLFWSKSGPGPD